MGYFVKEVYYTLQGEGLNAGRAAVFLRFSGCNLWSGREQDRSTGQGSCSKWCDTDFLGIDGPGGGRFTTAEDLAHQIASCWSTREGKPFVVCTGGEPLLQLDEPLVRALHDCGFEIAIETNGTKVAPPDIDWICVSPKAGAELRQTAGDELKVIYPQSGFDPATLEHLQFRNFLIQPLDDENREENTRRAVEFCMGRPRWRLSLQTHKQLRIR
jgi:7-carboxy-7-deazaguanine synthase